MISTSIRDRAAAALVAVLAALAVVAALFPLAAHAQTEPEPDVYDVDTDRVFGANRYATAAEIAETAYPEGSDDLVLASGETFPDALAGNYLAGLVDGPIVLTPAELGSDGALQPDTAAVIEQQSPERIWILGSAGAVSAEIEALLDEDHEVVRIGGRSRYETAAAIATVLFDDDEDANANVGFDRDGLRTAIVATGERFPDALVAGTGAFSHQLPVLLTPTASLHPAAAEALTALEIERVILMGGEGAVSVEVQSAVDGIESVERVDRVFGPGTARWGTAIAFSEMLRFEFGYSALHLNIAGAQGTNAAGVETRFADALAMGPLAGGAGGTRDRNPLVLVNGEDDVLVGTVLTYVRQLACTTSSLLIAGGTGAVSATIEQQLETASSDCRFTSLEIDPDEGPAGQEVSATFELTDDFETSDILFVAVFSDCVVGDEEEDGEGPITTLYEAEDGEPFDGTVTLTIDPDAEAPRPCELLFVTFFDDGAFQLLGVEFFIVAPAPPGNGG